MHANRDFIKVIVSTNTIPQTINKEKMKDMLQIIDVSGKGFLAKHLTISHS